MSDDLANGKSVSAPRPSPPAAQYSFTSFQVANPTAPPPGDRLDGEYARLNKAIQDTIAWVGISLNSDGSLRTPPTLPAPTDETGDLATAQLYAVLAQAWAEYMPGTIPPNILAVMDITGDHWSSRWWANRAAQIVTNAFSGATPPPGIVIPVFDSTVLPNGAAGSVNINGDGLHQITITLPVTPVLDQTLKFKDIAGNASAFPVQIHGGVNLIDGQSDFYLFQDYQAVELFWTGSGWGVR